MTRSVRDIVAEIRNALTPVQEVVDGVVRLGATNLEAATDAQSGLKETLKLLGELWAGEGKESEDWAKLRRIRAFVCWKCKVDLEKNEPPSMLNCGHTDGTTPGQYKGYDGFRCNECGEWNAANDEIAEAIDVAETIEMADSYGGPVDYAKMEERIFAERAAEDHILKRYQQITMDAFERSGITLDSDDLAQAFHERLESLLKILIDRYEKMRIERERIKRPRTYAATPEDIRRAFFGEPQRERIASDLIRLVDDEDPRYEKRMLLLEKRIDLAREALEGERDQ